MKNTATRAQAAATEVYSRLEGVENAFEFGEEMSPCLVTAIAVGEEMGGVFDWPSIEGATPSWVSPDRIVFEDGSILHAAYDRVEAYKPA